MLASVPAPLLELHDATVIKDGRPVLDRVSLTLRQALADDTTLLLVTHHTEEIVPEIGRVILLREGRVMGDGTPAQMLTAEHLGALLGVPVALDRAGRYVYARPVSAT